MVLSKGSRMSGFDLTLRRVVFEGEGFQVDGCVQHVGCPKNEYSEWSVEASSSESAMRLISILLGLAIANKDG